MKKFLTSVGPGVLFLILLGLSYYFFRNKAIVDALESMVHDSSALSVVTYILILVAATVVAPVSAVPLMPLASHLFGPFETALWSIIGWWIGAMIAFVIARYFSATLLVRFVSKERMEKYRHLIPKEFEFSTAVVLRLMTPVDFLSYVLGLFTAIPMGTYALATLIGISPFAFIYSYAGIALLEGNMKLLATIVLSGVVLFGIAYSVRPTFLTSKASVEMGSTPVVRKKLKQ